MFKLKYFIAFVLISSHVKIATCDYYSSVSGMDVLLQAEGYLLKSLEAYLPEENSLIDSEFVKALRHIKGEYLQAKNDTFGYIGNPISAFKLLKRFVVDWFRMENYFTEETGSSGFDENNLSLNLKDLQLPREDDLVGAALGLARLQETYNLNVSDLVDGKIYGVKYGSAMSASDCIELALILYDDLHYKRSLPWLIEAIRKVTEQSTPDKDQLLELMRYLSTVYFHLGNPKMALLINKEILRVDPEHADALENQEFFKNALLEDRKSRKLFRQPFVKPKEPTVDELAEQTCRGERAQTPEEQRPLRCMYTSKGLPYRLINPFKLEQLSLDPPVMYYHDLINDNQIKQIIAAGEPIIIRSKVGDAGVSVVSEVRTSKTGWLLFDDYEFLKPIANLLTDITELSMETAESLQIVNYGIGGHYGSHWDFSLEPIKAYGEQKGNRIATALFYLNDVELGGSTAFPFLKLNVPPVKGSLVLWYNLHESLEQDYRTKHTGCPVLKGSKWILNEWYHERGQEFTRPCSLNEQGHISAHYAYIL